MKAKLNVEGAAMMEDICKTLGVKFKRNGSLVIGFDEEDRKGIEILLEKGRKFTALFTASDVMAVGAIRALHEKGMRVPEDVSVIGFDGLEVGSYLVPKLSSVVQPAQMMAQRSVEILISQIKGESDAVHETVPFELWERESVSAPKP